MLVLSHKAHSSRKQEPRLICILYTAVRTHTPMLLLPTTCTSRRLDCKGCRGLSPVPPAHLPRPFFSVHEEGSRKLGELSQWTAQGEHQLS